MKPVFEKGSLNLIMPASQKTLPTFEGTVYQMLCSCGIECC